MNTLVTVVIPTLGRSVEVDALLESLRQQNYPHFEVIIVDQNGSDLLDEIVARHSPHMAIEHLRVSKRGLSHARNAGARAARGEIISLPDDDCEYAPDTIEQALRVLNETKSEVVFGRVSDRQGEDAVAVFAESAGKLSLAKHEGMFVDASIFARKPILLRFPYDETLGVGTFHGAEEGHDLVLRLLKGKIPLFYSPEILFYHPSKVSTHRSAAEIRRVFTYRCGFARVCLKHKLHARLANRFIKVALYLVFLSFFNRRKARYYFAELLGLLAGAVVK